MTASIQASNQSIFDFKSTEIQAGDTVIVYQSRDNLSAIVVTPGQQLNTRYGEFPHSAMIGTQFGSKCSSRKGNGFTYLLRPTPELWTLALPHRTQILYHPDISFVASQLDIKPGSYVVEAGTGSGSFSHSVARTIGRNGKLFSFEFHEERYSKAVEEFKSHGLLSRVGGPIELAHRNVIRDGFGDLAATADSVFLDLPAPWDALEDAKRVMNRSQLSRICCFSPCIEQVQKTCQTLESLGFSHITMFETLLRTHEPISVGTLKVDDAVQRIKEVETKKQARRQRQILESKQRKLATQKPANSKLETTEEIHKKRTLEDADYTQEPQLKKIHEDLDEITPQKECDDKEPEQTLELNQNGKTESNGVMNDQISGHVVPLKPQSITSQSSSKEENDDSQKQGNKQENLANKEINVKVEVIKAQSSTLETSKPACMSRGHTSFLTFAVLLPKHKP